MFTNLPDSHWISARKTNSIYLSSILSQLISLYTISNNTIPGCLAATPHFTISYTSYSSHLKCYAYNEHFRN